MQWKLRRDSTFYFSILNYSINYVESAKRLSRLDNSKTTYILNDVRCVIGFNNFVSNKLTYCA